MGEKQKRYWPGLAALCCLERPSRAPTGAAPHAPAAGITAAQRSEREAGCVLHHTALPPELARSFFGPCLRPSHNTANFTHIHTRHCADP